MRGQPQSGGQQVGQGLFMVLPEPGQHAVIGHVLRADDPERDIGMTQPFDLPRRTLTMSHRVHEQRQQHVRVIAAPAHPTPLRPGVKRGGVQLADRLDHEPHQMIFREPVGHRRRQQERLLTIHPPVRPSHP